jgi:hypothetical protein
MTRLHVLAAVLGAAAGLMHFLKLHEGPTSHAHEWSPACSQSFAMRVTLSVGVRSMHVSPGRGNRQPIWRVLCCVLCFVPAHLPCRYGGEHAAPELQKEAVYGLTEIYREQIKPARLVANPGCYPTTVQLPLYPLLKSKMILPEDIIIDAKSGLSPHYYMDNVQLNLVYVCMFVCCLSVLVVWTCASSNCYRT